MASDKEGHVGQEHPWQTPDRVAFSSGRQGSKACCPLGDQADPEKRVADVAQESILLIKYSVTEAACTDAEGLELEKATLSSPVLSEGVESCHG